MTAVKGQFAHVRYFGGNRGVLIMERERAAYWVGVLVLIILGFLAGQPIAMAVGTCVALLLAYEQLLKRSSKNGSEPSVRVS